MYTKKKIVFKDLSEDIIQDDDIHRLTVFNSNCSSGIFTNGELTHSAHYI
jgi:hypothetical protein